MFDIGFSELLLVGGVALLVLGPDKLPGAARTAGIMIGRLKRSFNSIKSEVEREIGADEIRRQIRSEELLSLRDEMKNHIHPTKPAPTEPASSAETVKAALDPEPKPDVLTEAPAAVKPELKTAPKPDSKSPT
ncbi:Sec-independent protein translocase protein TatB [Pseudomonas matsuisoli]|uniref:Sec-independent protein translocase protein TatB n=1 Tax=Pseudomonas matsuisoli TaxID=1515666 RepID=A0A917PYA8_9PSED|nr:Sec-independent protein translocase protein TatB [Pseudomonas matsuisoli]GGJ99420.1 sec-independent protein translocase protein TatB [Pseudomonas matsuisoli]